MGVSEKEVKRGRKQQPLQAEPRRFDTPATAVEGRRAFKAIFGGAAQMVNDAAEQPIVE
jgi:hypothetical protein